SSNGALRPGATDRTRRRHSRHPAPATRSLAPRNPSVRPLPTTLPARSPQPPLPDALGAGPPFPPLGPAPASTTGPHAPARWECPALPPPRGRLAADSGATPSPSRPTTNPTIAEPPPVPWPLPGTGTRRSGGAPSRCRGGLASATLRHGRSRAVRGTSP